MSSYTPVQYAGWRDELLHRPYQVFTPDQAITALADVLDGDEVLAYGLVVGHLQHQTRDEREPAESLLDTTDLAHLLHRQYEVLVEPDHAGAEAPAGHVAGFGHQQPGWTRGVEPTMCGAEEPVPYELTDYGLLVLDGDSSEPAVRYGSNRAVVADEAVLE